MGKLGTGSNIIKSVAGASASYEDNSKSEALSSFHQYKQIHEHITQIKLQVKEENFKSFDEYLATRKSSLKKIGTPTIDTLLNEESYPDSIKQLKDDFDELKFASQEALKDDRFNSLSYIKRLESLITKVDKALGDQLTSDLQTINALEITPEEKQRLTDEVQSTHTTALANLKKSIQENTKLLLDEAQSQYAILNHLVWLKNNTSQPDGAEIEFEADLTQTLKNITSFKQKLTNQVTVNANDNSISLKFPNRLFSLGYYNNSQNYTKSDLKACAEHIKAQGCETITMNIKHKDEKHCRFLAEQAYAACIEAGFEPKNIKIKYIGKDANGQQSHIEYSSPSAQSHQSAAKILKDMKAQAFRKEIDDTTWDTSYRKQMVEMKLNNTEQRISFSPNEVKLNLPMNPDEVKLDLPMNPEVIVNIPTSSSA